MMAGSSIEGSPESGWIVCGPGPGMAKSIVSRPGKLFAAMIAWRSDPGPSSSVFATVNVESRIRSSNRWATRQRDRRRAVRLGRPRDMKSLMGVILESQSVCFP